jgi:threonine/homoserine/homoserine lactone efflux protein
MAASAAGRWLRRSRAYLHFERYVGGAMLIALGITAALAGNNSKK